MHGKVYAKLTAWHFGDGDLHLMLYAQVHLWFRVRYTDGNGKLMAKCLYFSTPEARGNAIIDVVCMDYLIGSAS